MKINYCNTTPLLVVLAGQSNAGGFGTTGNDVPTDLQTAQPDVYIWRNTAISGPPIYGWATYQAGVNSEPAVVVGGPQKWAAEAEFAKMFRLENPNAKMFFVRSALAGSQLENSNIFLMGGPSNDWSPSSTGELFDNTKNTIGSAISKMSSSYGITNFDTLILWMQGESDGSYNVTSSHYYQNMIDFITAVRSEWGMGSNVSFMIGRIQPLSWPYNGPVRMAVGRIAAGDMINVKMIDTDDCQLLGDKKHYNAIGQISIGARFWQAYTDVLPNVAISLPSEFIFNINEQEANQTIVGTISPSNSPYPSPIFELFGGETDGFIINQNTGKITVGDGTKLIYINNPTRIFSVRASNGINTTFTMVTVNLNKVVAVNDINNTLVRFDPHDSSFYTLVNGAYSTISDTKGSGKILIQNNSNRRPIQTILPGSSKNSLNCNNSDGNYNSIVLAPSSNIVNDTYTDFTIGCIVRPESGSQIGNITFICVFVGASTPRFGIFYDYSTSKFGISATNTLGSNNNIKTVNTFPPDITYRVRARKVGTVLEFFVNDKEEALTTIGNLKSTILNSGEIGGLAIGGSGMLAGIFTGYIGLGRFIRGNPSILEVDFLNNELSSWI